MSPKVKGLPIVWLALVPMAALVLWAQADGPRVIMGLQNPPPVHLTERLPSGTMQEKAATACTECHEARIIVQQRLNKAVWTKEVDKMIKWGAVVDAGDRDALIDYLSINFSPEAPPYVPPRSEKEAGKKTGSGTSK
ncbi:MAG TPA: hypothetical protein VMP68_24920 [Candidatus Eisenbacteria bacterium]|nr:hypothetical protein [Candidatus Eisenbacteria bacterium]